MSETEALLAWAKEICPDVTKLEDLADGVAFVMIIERLGHVELNYNSSPTKFKHRLLNAKVALRTAKEYGIETDITREDIVAGDAEALCGFLKTLREQSVAFRSRSASQIARYSRSYDDSKYNHELVVLSQAAIRRHMAARELQRLRKLDAHRNQVALEIWSSEKIYVEGLEMLNAYKDQLEFNLKVSPDPLMTREQINEVFLNSTEIFNYNQLVFEQLTERIGEDRVHWSRSQKLGDIFIQMAPYLKLYQFYCNAYDHASQLCEELRSREVMKTFLAGVMSQGGTGIALPLEALLIMPVQRVPRYILLLKDLIKHTNPEHLDYEDLCDGLHKIQRTANTVNDSIRQAEMMNKVYSIQEKINGSDVPVLLEPGRFFVHEGALAIVQLDSKRNKEFESCWFFLFNDALVYVGAKSFQFKGMLNFKSYNVRMKDIPDMGVVSNAIMLVSPEKTLTVACDSLEDKMVWMAKISNQLANTLQAQYSRSVEEDVDSGDLMAGVSATITGTEVRQDKSKNKFTVYTILVSSKSGTYTVFHRYSEFDSLYHKLKKKFPNEKLVALPKKHILGNLGSSVVESRQVMLENFLEDVLMKPVVCNSSDFVIFLQPSDNYSAVTQLKKDKKKMKLLKEDQKRASSRTVQRLPPGVSRPLTMDRPMSSVSVDHIQKRTQPREKALSTLGHSGPVEYTPDVKPLPSPPSDQPPAELKLKAVNSMPSPAVTASEAAEVGARRVSVADAEDRRAKQSITDYSQEDSAPPPPLPDGPPPDSADEQSAPAPAPAPVPAPVVKPPKPSTRPPTVSVAKRAISKPSIPAPVPFSPPPVPVVTPDSTSPIAVPPPIAFTVPPPIASSGSPASGAGNSLAPDPSSLPPPIQSAVSPRGQLLNQAPSSLPPPPS